jgi:hypothetical protein
MSIPDKDIPRFVRRCWDSFRRANITIRHEETERLKMYVGGDLQWRPEELEKRRNKGRPWITINKCKPAVDQVEGDIRLNPPGPQCHPVGDGADAETADIIEGLIRECEYRSGAKVAYATAGKYSAAGGTAALELATEFVDERSFAQQLVIKSVEDPAMVFWDPAARMANRQDASWAGKLRMYSTREDFIAEFGEKRRVLQATTTGTVIGWMQEAMGIDGELAQIKEWTGAGKGPYYVAEFYHVEYEPVKLRVYSDHIARFEDEPVPEGVVPADDKDSTRTVNRRHIVKYVVDALEVHSKTDWFGSIPPIIPVLGPEIYIDGKLHRLSLIAGALDAQRALNYVATTATEIAGTMPKSPWIGPAGTFDDPRWETANQEIWAYLEYKPVFITAEDGSQQLAPAPQRNQWEAPIQWVLALAAYFSDCIKAVTSIYDPSLGVPKGDQSGRAIQQLRSESSVGTFSYTDNLHNAIEIMYNEMVIIFPQIMDGPRVQTIVKADSQHEVVLINQEFPPEDPGVGFGEHGGLAAKREKRNGHHIGVGRYSVRTTAGPSFETRQDEAATVIADFISKVPGIASVPGVAERFLRLVGKGNPTIEGMADLLHPPGPDKDANPQQIAAALQQAQQQNQALTAVVQKLQQALQTKMPELEFKKWQTAIEAVTRIRVAEITASKDLDKATADREAAALDNVLNMAHDQAMQATEHQHAARQQQAAAEQQQQQAQTVSADQ